VRVRHRRQATLVRVRVAYLLSASGSISCTANYFKIMDWPTCQIAAAYVSRPNRGGIHTSAEGPSGCYVQHYYYYLNLNLTGASGPAYQPLCAGPPRPPNMRTFHVGGREFPMCAQQVSIHTLLCRLSIRSAAPAPHARVRAAGNETVTVLVCLAVTPSTATPSTATPTFKPWSEDAATQPSLPNVLLRVRMPCLACACDAIWLHSVGRRCNVAHSIALVLLLQQVGLCGATRRAHLAPCCNRSCWAGVICKLGDAGATQCPGGFSKIMDVATCKAAAESFGSLYGGRYGGSTTAWDRPSCRHIGELPTCPT
jgi:hypothetical protein